MFNCIYSAFLIVARGEAAVVLFRLLLVFKLFQGNTVLVLLAGP